MPATDMSEWTCGKSSLCWGPSLTRNRRMFQKRLISALALASEMNTSSLAKLALETELRHAIDRNEFVLHFQPKLDMKSNRIVSVAALVRWQHPRHGLVYPGEFIALAEETGMIMDLGGIVIE